jgi:hypothetical protein
MTTQSPKALTFTSIPGGYVGLEEYKSLSGQNKGVVSNYLLNVNLNWDTFQANRRSAYVAALAKLAKLDIDEVVAQCPSASAELGKTQAKKTPTPEALVAQVVGELAKSWQKSIDRIDLVDLTREPNHVAYRHLAPGLKVHPETGELHLSGLVAQRNVVDDSAHVAKASRPKTLVKAFVASACGLSLPKWAQFKLSGTSAFAAVRGAGLTITPADIAAL